MHTSFLNLVLLERQLLLKLNKYRCPNENNFENEGSNIICVLEGI
jgi:hypothetical protein